MVLHLARERRLMLVIGISASFFILEISVGFYTRSFALVADAFHYLNDLVGFIVAFVALKVSQRIEYPKELPFGWQRAQLLGAFFNGVFLLSLGITIFLQSIDRFISLQKIENPKLVLVVGCAGLSLNIASGLFLHGHDHEHAHDHNHSEGHRADAVKDGLSFPVDGSVLELRGARCSEALLPHVEHRHHVKPRSKKIGHDLGMTGVLVHVVGDALNNIGVIIAALVIWQAHYEGRYYADPAVSMGISLMILLSSLPLVRKSGEILLQSVPLGLDPEDVKHDIEAIPGVESVHELHIWRLNQEKAIASAHLVVSGELLSDFTEKAKIINECFHAYGIHSTTLQPEPAHKLSSETASVTGTDVGNTNLVTTECNQGMKAGPSVTTLAVCQVNCRNNCELYTCCI